MMVSNYWCCIVVRILTESSWEILMELLTPLFVSHPVYLLFGIVFSVVECAIEVLT